MKHLILFLGLFSIGLAQAQVSIIADLDDTIKITNVHSKPALVYNGLITNKVFIGMPEFLAEARAYSNGLHVVTATPGFVRSRIHSTLFKNDIEAEGLYLRNKIISKLKFKVDAITKILSQTTDQVILLGDDVGNDPEVYAVIQSSFPDRVLATYIHVVKNHKVFGNQIRYWTSFDLALREYVSGRMTAGAVKKVGESLLQSSRPDRIFPRFAECPTDTSVYDWHAETDLRVEGEELTKKLKQFCLTRAGK